MGLKGGYGDFAPFLDKVVQVEMPVSHIPDVFPSLDVIDVVSDGRSLRPIVSPRVEIEMVDPVLCLDRVEQIV